MLLWSLVFVWIVLFVRQSLIYIVLVLALAFAWPVVVFPPMRDTAKKAVELLVALIIAKPIMMLAMSVGIAALGGIGATAPPTEIDCQGAAWADCFARNAEQANRNMQIEIGALVTGVVAFGLAAFMPFLIWKLMPLVAAAVVAQGVASAPMRASQTGDAVLLLRPGDDEPASRPAQAAGARRRGWRPGDGGGWPAAGATRRRRRRRARRARLTTPRTSRSRRRERRVEDASSSAATGSHELRRLRPVRQRCR